VRGTSPGAGEVGEFEVVVRDAVENRDREGREHREAAKLPCACAGFLLPDRCKQL
jgi:hypothetical protein